MKKKLLCLVLSFTMLAVFMPSMAFAGDDVEVVPANVVTNAQELQDAVGFFHSGDQVVSLKNNIKLDERVNVHGNVIINLNGKTINGNGNQIFSVANGSTLTLKNGTLTGGVCLEDREPVDYGCGGAVYVDTYAKATLENVVVTGNKAGVRAGAIEVKGTLELAGLVNISGNTDVRQNAVSNVFVEPNAKVFDKGLKAGSRVGIDGEKEQDLVVGDQKTANYFFADKAENGVAYKPGESKGFNLYVDEAYKAAANNANYELDALKVVKGNAISEKTAAQVEAIVDNAKKAVSEVSSAPQVKAIVAKAKQEVAVVVGTRLATVGVAAGVDAALYAAGKVEVAVKEMKKQADLRAKAVRENIEEALIGAGEFTVGATEFIAKVYDLTVVKPYEGLLKRVNNFDGGHSDTIALIKKVALEEVSKPVGNLATKTLVLKTALQEMEIVKYVQGGLKEIAKHIEFK